MHLISLLSVLLATPALGATGGNPAAARAERGGVDPVEVLESGGAWLVDLITPNGDEHRAEGGWESTESPRHAVMTFMRGMRRLRTGHDSWALVARTLPPDRADDRASADALYEVLLRLSPIEPIDLPASSGLDDGQTRYELFPEGIDHEWVWRALDGAPDGRIVLLRAGADDWRFSGETLDGAPRLEASLSPIAPAYESDGRGALFADILRPTAHYTPWWGWFAGLGILMTGILVGRFGRRRLRRLEVKAGALDTALHALGTPAFLLALTLGTVFGSLMLHFGPVLSELRWLVVRLLGLMTVVWTLVGLADLGTVAYREWFGKDNPYQVMALTVVRRILRIIVFVMVLLFVLENIFNFRVGALVGSLGLAGLALSLAGKDAAKNLFGALVVFFTRPFVVGDWINFEGYLGTVEDVGVQATRMRLLSGEVVTVPNMKFVDKPVENLSRREEIRREMTLSLPYGTDSTRIDEIISTVCAVLRRDDLAGEGCFDLEERPPEVALAGFEADHLELRVYYWYQMGEAGEVQRDVSRGWYSYLHHCTAVNRALIEALDALDVELAFPTRTVHLAERAPDAAPRGDRDEATRPAS